MQIPVWKRVIILGLCALGVILAMPNLFYNRVEVHNTALAKIARGGSTPALEKQAAEWPSWLPSDIVNLGLDLRGGAHLLAEVHLSDVYADRMNSLWRAVPSATSAASRPIAPSSRSQSRSPKAWPRPWRRCGAWPGRWCR
jgi:preprotein translocase subunit SecD